MSDISRYGVTVDDVLRVVQIDTRAITDTSYPVSRSDVQTYIDDAGSELAGLMSKGGMSIDADSVDANTKGFLARGIKAYGAMQVLLTLSQTGALYDRQKEQWDDVRSRLANNPNAVVAAPSTFRGNVPSTRASETNNGRYFSTRYRW